MFSSEMVGKARTEPRRLRIGTKMKLEYMFVFCVCAVFVLVGVVVVSATVGWMLAELVRIVFLGFFWVFYIYVEHVLTLSISTYTSIHSYTGTSSMTSGVDGRWLLDPGQGLPRVEHG